jgi:tRNA(adenine34) deaminase
MTRTTEVQAELDEVFMREAIRLARQSLDGNGLPTGAVVVMDGEIIGRGRKNSGERFFFNHAEMLAMVAAFRVEYDRSTGQSNVQLFERSSITLYSTLEPCIMCFGTAVHTPVKRIVFALEDPGAGATNLPPNILSERVQGRFPVTRGGVLRAEMIELMREFLERNSNPTFWRNSPVGMLVQQAR